MTRKYDLNEIGRLSKLAKYKPVIKEKYVNLHCFTGTHDDLHPSMFIYPDGTIYCYGCGYKGHITEISDRLQQTIEIVSLDPLKDKLKELELAKLQTLELPASARPISFPYKNISVQTLRRFNVSEFDSWIIVPVYMFGSCVGFYYTDGTRKIYSKNKTLWGDHFSRYTYPNLPGNYTILVEGIFDAFALIDRGFNATAVFGTAFTGNEKLMRTKLFSILSNPDIRKIFIWLDSDPAGLDASYKLKEFLEKHIQCEILYFPYEGDPDELIGINSIQEELREKIKELSHDSKMHKMYTSPNSHPGGKLNRA